MTARDRSGAAGVVIAGPAGRDPAAPFGALALIMFLCAPVLFANIHIGAIAFVDDGLGTAVELDRAEPVGAVLGILGLGMDGDGQGEEEKGEQRAGHLHPVARACLRHAEPQRACVIGHSPICAPSMSTPRKTLSLSRVVAPAEGPALSAEAQIIAQAVRRKLAITAVYNRTGMTIAPHILYTKHEDLFVDGVVTLRDGKVPPELKLGTFKLAGLNTVSLTVDAFTVQPFYDPTDAKYDGVTVAKVD
jgi:hypothetical protein